VKIVLRYSLFLSALTLTLLAVFLGYHNSPAHAQITQQDINSSLCSGSNIDFSGNSTSCDSNGGATVNELIHKVINILSLLVGVVAVIMIIVGGLRYITSGGNDTSVTGAKNTILYAVVGLVIVAVAQIIVHFVLSTVASSTGG
jgi:Type IV secretion system pilin